MRRFTYPLLSNVYPVRMPKDHLKANNTPVPGRSAAANSQSGGISLPAVNPFAQKAAPTQLMRITSATLNATIDTKTETDINLLNDFRLRNLKKPKRLAAIDARIKVLEAVNPFSGFRQAIPGQKPPPARKNKPKKKGGKQKPPQPPKHTTPLNPKVGRSVDEGQDFKKKELPHKFTPLTNPSGDESKVPRIKVDKLALWDGTASHIQYFPELRGNEEVMVPHIQCAYTLEWIRAEEADLDHVIPTRKLKDHLLSIAIKMNTIPGYENSVKKWLTSAGLTFRYWFINPKGEWTATRWAMYELHNSRGNLVFSSKHYNQQGKSNKSTLALIKENPWYGERFFSKHQFLEPVNNGLSNVKGEPLGDLIENHFRVNHGETSSALALEKGGERKMATRIKQRGLGQLDSEPERRKSLSRKLRLRNDIADASSDASSASEDEHEDEDIGRVKMIRQIIAEKQLEAQFPEADEFEKLKKENAALKKELEETRKRSRSDTPAPLVDLHKKQKITGIANDQNYKRLDTLLGEQSGTNLNRIKKMTRVYHNDSVFIEGFIAIAKQEYGNDGWRTWTNTHQRAWTDAKAVLRQIYNSQ
ncbi:hypothetical protein [Chitinophaga sp. S165]|uniref:hypothetical protein n=1 Tax=Chitinophaga sp. S165 TaxID=2135462 RepID=UPI000D8AA89C|nr:hypothetical protein [Chitinophaga sp. S165]PWV56470.1 hypothetical protein C7475_101986 [Chitinophaga sp. S165]